MIPILKLQSLRYANNAEEDKVAEEAIHREALERSTASGIQRSFMLPNTSMMTTNMSDVSKSNDYQADDYGGGYDDFDDGDGGDDDAFDNFVAMDDHAEKYSSESFQNDLTQDEFVNSSTASTDKASPSTAPSTFLDEICSGDALTQGGKFNYFNPDLIEKLTSGNQWAGSAHWKKNQSTHSKKVAKKKDGEEKTRKDQKRKTTKEPKQTSLIDLNISSCHHCLDALLSKKKPSRGKGATTDQSQLTKAAQQKYERERNILPLDAGINANHFTEFFMRPGASLTQSTGNAAVPEPKTVGFLGIDTEHFDDGVDDSYDDGPGFELADNDDVGCTETEDFVVQELDGIRKVEKVRVSHATVAKKVDVKRLKNDLWAELEASTAPVWKEPNEEIDGEVTSAEENMDDGADDERVVSFKNTVNKLGTTEAQADVSLPFYFICVLHLANEKGLKLENGEHGLNDFIISRDCDIAP